MDLELSRSQLLEIKEALTERIRIGLAEDGTEIRALPAYLPSPPPSLAGRALVLDTGGTNMRAAMVELEPNGQFDLIAGPVQTVLPVRDEDHGLDATAFFDLHAELARQVHAEPGLPVGYCFSYPSEILPSGDARLLHWTKGIDVPGVAGARVGSALSEALGRAQLAPSRVRVLNDTVASLLGGAVSFRGETSNVIGLIVGTGTNMASFFSPDQAPKLTAPMSVNLESGNFNPPQLSELDERLDRASDQPGTQRFEKAVSGHYLPYLFALACPDHPGFDPQLGARALVRLAESREAGPAPQIARALLDRSAQMVAAGLSAVMSFHPRDVEVGILAEGGLFWSTPRYVNTVRETVESLSDGQPFEIMKIPHANLLGSACAALS